MENLKIGDIVVALNNIKEIRTDGSIIDLVKKDCIYRVLDIHVGGITIKVNKYGYIPVESGLMLVKNFKKVNSVNLERGYLIKYIQNGKTCTSISLNKGEYTIREIDDKVRGQVVEILKPTYKLLDNTDYAEFSFEESAKKSIKDKIEKIGKNKKEILDKKEKEYLLAVIKPFRKEFKYIMKAEYGSAAEFINIRMKESIIDLPIFKKGTMYLGMEMGKKYTKEELGL